MDMSKRSRSILEVDHPIFGDTADPEAVAFWLFQNQAEREPGVGRNLLDNPQALADLAMAMFALSEDERDQVLEAIRKAQKAQNEGIRLSTVHACEAVMGYLVDSGWFT